MHSVTITAAIATDVKSRTSTDIGLTIHETGQTLYVTFHQNDMSKVHHRGRARMFVDRFTEDKAREPVTLIQMLARAELDLMPQTRLSLQFAADILDAASDVSQ